jgi:DNA-directed RNA polymerase specialized sigma24 family protein
MIEGLRQSRIAARLGHPLRTVKTRTRRGMTRLCEYLAAAG